MDDPVHLNSTDTSKVVEKDYNHWGFISPTKTLFFFISLEFQPFGVPLHMRLDGR